MGITPQNIPQTSNSLVINHCGKKSSDFKTSKTKTCFRTFWAMGFLPIPLCHLLVRTHIRACRSRLVKISLFCFCLFRGLLSCSIFAKINWFTLCGIYMSPRTQKGHTTTTPLAAICLVCARVGSPAPCVRALNCHPRERLGLSLGPYSIFSNCKVHFPWKAWEHMGQWSVTMACHGLSLPIPGSPS